MSCPNNITLPPVVYKDTWSGLTNCSFSLDGRVFDDNLSSVRMFFKDEQGNVGLELTTANNKITIDDANAWQFTNNPVSPSLLAVGNWYWSIETTDSAGVIKTRVFGTISILNDATQ